MRKRKWGFPKKEQLRLYLVIGLFLVSGIWYSRAVARGTLQMGEETALAELEEIPAPQLEAESVMGKIDLNTADAEELMRLNGIGEKRAEDIIAYREEKGGFRSIEELMEVSGIGEKLFAQIKEDITVAQ